MQLTTPYGDTSFSREVNSPSPQARWVEAMDANGDVERVEYVNASPFEADFDPVDLPTSGGLQVATTGYQYARMSYYWSKEAMKLAGECNYLSAEWTHFVHDYNMKTGDVIEFQSAEIERLQAEVARRLGYRLVHHRLELYAVPLDDDKR